MSTGGGACRPDRYEFAPSMEQTIEDVLQSISEFPYGLTRCEIEARNPKLLHGAIAQALCDLVERGQVEPCSDLRESRWVTVWVAK